jgi:hypothetical protein
VSATRPRKPFTSTSTTAFIRGTSGSGCGGWPKSWRHTAAPKQNALNRISSEPATIVIQFGTMPSRSFFAPMPLASAARPVRTQAA